MMQAVGGNKPLTAGSPFNLALEGHLSAAPSFCLCSSLLLPVLELQQSKPSALWTVGQPPPPSSLCPAPLCPSRTPLHRASATSHAQHSPLPSLGLRPHVRSWGWGLGAGRPCFPFTLPAPWSSSRAGTGPYSSPRFQDQHLPAPESFPTEEYYKGIRWS